MIHQHVRQEDVVQYFLGFLARQAELMSGYVEEKGAMLVVESFERVRRCRR